ncbi:hypothetical protein EVAR_79473_1 [Eumeta japonica]|uniref:Uncharacterized protein n=1 Tax=Eumeta variegata TaxID=151549 RepID=A0A4C1UF65_EUMVA|nr:hypothetical protein EVAR_79473_1 [Eumeta japonica]
MPVSFKSTLLAIEPPPNFIRTKRIVRKAGGRFAQILMNSAQTRAIHKEHSSEYSNRCGRTISPSELVCSLNREALVVFNYSHVIPKPFTLKGSLVLTDNNAHTDAQTDGDFYTKGRGAHAIGRGRCDLSMDRRSVLTCSELN